MHPPLLHLPLEQEFTLFERILCQPCHGTSSALAGSVSRKYLKCLEPIDYARIWHSSSIQNSSEQPAKHSTLGGDNDYGHQNRRGVDGCSVSSSHLCRHQPRSDREMVSAVLKRTRSRFYVLARDQIIIRMGSPSHRISAGIPNGFACIQVSFVVVCCGQAVKGGVILAGRTDSVPLRSCGTGAGLFLGAFNLHYARLSPRSRCGASCIMRVKPPP
jgi:hypothetical protein